MFFYNYQPVSALTNFSNVFEKIMFDRLINFIEIHKILYKHEFGFRKNHSTSIMALIKLIDTITSAIDRKQIVLVVFLDSSKAFDIQSILKFCLRNYKYMKFGILL